MQPHTPSLQFLYLTSLTKCKLQNISHVESETYIIHMMLNYMKLIVNDSNIGLMIKLKWYVYVFIYVCVSMFSTSTNFVYFFYIHRGAV